MVYLCSFGFLIITIFLPAMERLWQIRMRFNAWAFMCFAFLFAKPDVITAIGSTIVMILAIYELIVDLIDYKKNKERYRRHTY